jgi:hypothetical protein
MTDPAEKNALPPIGLAVAAGTAVLCSIIIYNALAGQDGRQRDVLSRLSDLEQNATLPVTIGVGAFDARPTTKSMVTIEDLAELAANQGQREIRAAGLQSEPSADLAQLDVRAVQRGLARLGYSPGPEDGVLGARTREAIRKFERDRDLPETGTFTDALAQEITRVLSGGG